MRYGNTSLADVPTTCFLGEMLRDSEGEGHQLVAVEEGQAANVQQEWDMEIRQGSYSICNSVDSILDLMYPKEKSEIIEDDEFAHTLVSKKKATDTKKPKARLDRRSLAKTVEVHHAFASYRPRGKAGGLSQGYSETGEIRVIRNPNVGSVLVGALSD